MNSISWLFVGPGCYPKHLPDAFQGSVNLNGLEVPSPVQGVYDRENDTFWGNGAPGCTLEYIDGGADYLVCVTEACEWEIPLGIATIIGTRSPFWCRPGSIEVIAVEWQNISYLPVDGKIELSITLPNGSTFIRSSSIDTLEPDDSVEKTFSVKFDAIGVWKIMAELHGEVVN